MLRWPTGHLSETREGISPTSRLSGGMFQSLRFQNPWMTPSDQTLLTADSQDRVLWKVLESGVSLSKHDRQTPPKSNLPETVPASGLSPVPTVQGKLSRFVFL